MTSRIKEGRKEVGKINCTGFICKDKIRGGGGGGICRPFYSWLLLLLLISGWRVIWVGSVYMYGTPKRRNLTDILTFQSLVRSFGSGTFSDKGFHGRCTLDLVPSPPPYHHPLL